MSDLFELDDDVEILFTVGGCKIIDYSVVPFMNPAKHVFGFTVHWEGSCGFGEFVYYNYGDHEKLNTEHMGREFCAEFMKHIFNRCEVDYKED